MAEVLLGRLHGHSGFERISALKRVQPALAQQPGFVSMFLDEARLVASIRHPNVVQVSELLHENHELCIVMEYLEGETLASTRHALLAHGAPMAPALAAWVAAEVAAGLHAAHCLEDAQGHPLHVVHRDLSPGNVFLTYSGAVKLLDFGVAHARGRLTQTESGVLKGKLEYMSPEQASGSLIDARSDVFSLGVVFWELVTGRSLFRRLSPLAVASAVVDGPVVPPSRLAAGVSPELDGICLKALARRVEQRYQTAAEFRRALLAECHREAGTERPGPDAISAMMARLFAERITEKTEMLRRASAGASDVVVLPDPVMLEDVPQPVSTSASARRTPARGLSWWVALGGSVLIAVGAWWSGASNQSPVVVPAAVQAKPAPEPEPVVAPPISEVAAVPPTVRIRIETDPSAAEVELDGRALGRSPVEIQLERSARPSMVLVRKPGFELVRNHVVPDGDQKMLLHLTRRRSPKPPPEAPPPPPVDPLDQKW